ncbi:peptidylprolyl isomerase [Actinocorallia lasiicapitis]
MAGKDRNKQLARERFERQQARRAAEEAKAKRQRTIGAVIASVVVLGAGVAAFVLTRGDDKKDDVVAQPTGKTAAPGECAYTPTAEAAAKDVGIPPADPPATAKKTVNATIKTNVGDVKVELDGKKAPCTVNSFTYLASKDYYAKTPCHRLTVSEEKTGLKVLQCGDPSGSGNGGPGYGYGVENVKDAKYAEGVLAMARTSDPNSNGSQFFIVYGDSTSLPSEYTVFGKVTEGLDKIKEVGKAGAEAPDANGNTAPKKKVEISSITIAK